MSMLDSVLKSLGQSDPQGMAEAQGVTTSLMGGISNWRKRLKEEEEERQRLIKQEEDRRAQLFSVYELGDKQPKKAFGVDVSGLLGDQYGYTRTMKIGDKTVSQGSDKFIEQFDSMSKEAQKIYVSGAKAKIADFENRAATAYEEAKKAGKSDDEAMAEASKIANDSYFAAVNTINTLDKSGKFKGNLMDFIEGSNDKLFGGLTRGAMRTGAFVTGNKDKADEWIKNAGQDGDGGEFTSFGKAGETFGSVQKGVVDVASMVIPAAGATKLASGLGAVDKLAKGGRAAQVASKVLPHAAGSLSATGVGAVQDVAAGRDQDLVKNALIGTAIDIALPGIGKAFRAGDQAAGQQVARILGGEGGDKAMSRTLQEIADNGVMGGLNKMLNRAGTRLSYNIGDALSTTKAGSKLIDLKDDFMTKWVSEMHPLYKELKRSDFEGKTTGAYLAAREAIGNSNRALSYAQDFIENNENMTKITAGVQMKASQAKKTIVQGRKDFDEFAKIKSDLDLQAAGKKQFTKEHTAKLEARMSKIKEDYSEEYDSLVQFYKDLNDFRLQEGLISKQQYDDFAKEGFDYVRVQRELPDWMLDKPATKGRGSTASITGSDAVQKRSKYASAEQLSPIETAIKTAQLAHVEAYRNQAAKRVYGLLNEAGEAKLLRTTDIVREKQAILKEMAEGKKIATKINKAIRTHKSKVADLKKEIKWIQNSGKVELNRNIKAVLKDMNAKSAGKSALISDRQMMDALVALETPDLRKFRRMIEGRNAKLEPLMDRIESLSSELSELSSRRSELYQQAKGMKTSVNKASQTTMSFLDDGVENVARIDPAIASAVHNWDKQAQNVMSEVLRFSNNVFKYGTTGANVGFALPNFVADQVGSAINSKNLLATHSPRNFVHSFFMSIGKPLNARDAEVLRAYMRGNAQQTSINQYTKRATADKAANKIMRRNASLGEKAYTVIRHPREGFRALFDATEEMVSLTENLTRIQNFRGTMNKAVKQGIDESDAIRLANQAARENSVDFLEAGSYGRVVNSFIPYFNAAVQGNRVMLRNAAERPASFVAKMTALIGVPIAASTAWNTSDPDRKAIYDTIPEYVKETNFVVIGPGAKWNEEKKRYDGVFLMKKPPGFKEFAEPVRKFMEYKADDPNGGMDDFLREQGGSMLADGMQTFSPLDFSSPEKFLSSATPQLLKPTAEAILNRNFFQERDIVGEYMQDLAPEDQKYENYSKLTTHIGALFNTSPLKVDHWIRQTFGEVGTNAQHYADRLMGAEENEQGGRSLPESIQRRFYGPPGGADTSAFYEIYNKQSNMRKRTSSKVTELVKAGRWNEARRRAEEYNDSIEGRFSSFLEQFSDSPTFDEEWLERIESLKIKTTDQAFKARERQK